MFCFCVFPRPCLSTSVVSATNREGVTVLRIIQSSIFDSPAQTLVNTVNTVGVMGKGIAKGFKARYPEMFREYKEFCDRHVIRIGTLHCWRSPSRWVLNFPTKTTWKQPSKIEFIEAGLKTFAHHYKDLGIQSISFPPLGCGNGQLDWADVRPVMLKYLFDLDIPIFIHEWFPRSDIPEQFEPEARTAPFTYGEFLKDLHAVVDDVNGRFQNVTTGVPFTAQFDEENNICVFLDNKYTIPEEFILTAWAGMQTGLLTSHTLGSEVDELASYLLSIVAKLPYVRGAPVELGVKQHRRQSKGFFLKEASSRYNRFTVDTESSAA